MTSSSGSLVVERPSLDGPLAHDLSVEELEQIRESIRNSVDRTQAELERIEELIVAASLREARRGTVAKITPLETPANATTPPRGMAQE